MKYIIPEATFVGYIDAEFCRWEGITSERKCVFTEKDLVESETYKECASKYGLELANLMKESVSRFFGNPIKKWYFRSQRREKWLYFRTYDPKRPLIEVKKDTVEIRDEK